MGNRAAFTYYDLFAPGGLGDWVWSATLQLFDLDQQCSTADLFDKKSD